VNFDVSVVADKPQLAKLIHEVANPGSRGPNHFRQGCLTDIRIDRLRAAFLAKICQQQEKSCKPPFTRIEELVDEVLLNPAARRHKPLSMPITAIVLSNFRDMACSLSLVPLPCFFAGWGRARPDHPISGPSHRSSSSTSKLFSEAMAGKKSVHNGTGSHLL